MRGRIGDTEVKVQGVGGGAGAVGAAASFPVDGRMTILTMPELVTMEEGTGRTGEGGRLTLGGLGEGKRPRSTASS